MIERPVHIRRIVGQGGVVALLGHYEDDGTRACITLPRHPFVDFWRHWAAAGHPQPVFHDAHEARLRFE